MRDKPVKRDHRTIPFKYNVQNIQVQIVNLWFRGIRVIKKGEG
jgi:hypothetical protein